MGTHAELLAKDGQYRKLYELQFADEEEDAQLHSWYQCRSA